MTADPSAASLVAQLRRLVGRKHVLTGEHRGSEGRKTFTASTLHDADGRIVGRAEHVWIAVDPARFNG